MNNKHIPDYINKADYNTNSPSYYHDLARKNELIKLLAEKIWEYEKTITDYILENDLLMTERLENWDQRIDEMPEEMQSLFIAWLEDGTLNQIINHDIFGSITAQLIHTRNHLEEKKTDKTFSQTLENRLNGVIAGLTGEEEFYTPIGLEEYMTSNGQEWGL